MISECKQSARLTLRSAAAPVAPAVAGVRVCACARACGASVRTFVSVCVRVCVWTHASCVSRVCAVGHGQAWRVSSHSFHGRGRCGQPAGRLGAAAAGGAGTRSPVPVQPGLSPAQPHPPPPVPPTGGHGLKSWCPWGALRVRVPAPKWNPVLPPSGCAHVRGWAGSESRLLHPATGDSHLRSPASLAGRLGPLQAGGDSGEGPDCGFWSLAAPGSPWEAEARPAECVCPTRDGPRSRDACETRQTHEATLNDPTWPGCPTQARPHTGSGGVVVGGWGGGGVSAEGHRAAFGATECWGALNVLMPLRHVL